MLELLALLEVNLLAQVTMEELKDEGLDKLMIVALIIAVGGIIIGGFQIARGEIAHAIFVIIGSLVIAGAVPIANALFEAAGAL